MISIKAAVIAASAVGAVAAGGVTWASVAQTDAAPRSAHDRLPAAVNDARQGTPKVLPSCLPASELAKKGKDAVGKGTSALPDARRQVPGTSVQPGPGEVKAPVAKPGVPNVELPPCPDVSALPKQGARVPSAPGVPQAPEVPQVPGVGGLNCDKLAPAVEVGSPLERTVMLSKGLKYVSSKTGVRKVGAAQACTVTQKWVSRAAGTAGWVTVERIKTPARTAEQEVRKAVGVPAGAVRTTTANGVVVLQAPAGQSGVLMIDPAGYALFLNGSPVASTSLQDVAARLAKVRG
ncbi:hypothetical protein Acsp03_50460 [Actinomadura sp. NBRC 104412]|uniref:hypothetical protein n=1 Tax=Actinomadura sp. NBRC 104412 TaxID=3032203 RepID=UPI0024A41107|nr:hypothetical protein [Actinomadura sp. NBRC 104412]GLZ07580.1 hypothetical protein Acsp03_50460 [Actinomadura sp. NBRC 104412]